MKPSRILTVPPSARVVHKPGFGTTKLAWSLLLALGLGFAIPSTQAQALVETGGSFAPNNLATMPGATAFAQDSIGVPFDIAKLNDGLYGNGNAWIAGSDFSFFGISFNTTVSIGALAFGRDNTGVMTDRTLGNHFLVEYTTTPNPDAGTRDSLWLPLTDFDYTVNPPGDSSVRHLYTLGFNLDVTGIRVRNNPLPIQTGDQGNLVGDYAAIDEFELYSAVPEPGIDALIALGLAAMGLYPFFRWSKAAACAGRV
ncbi:MAG: hypothetical protein JWR69_1056 [Pedosphaera sp.]|nr:hypothetical protein [Pedosphaera sp.]